MTPPDGEVVTVRIDASSVDLESVAAVALQIPLARTLAARTPVVVLGAAVRRRGMLGRWLGDKSVPVARAVRCTALLVRGYVDVGADATRAWGYAP
jgi:hypothetical protein